MSTKLHDAIHLTETAMLCQKHHDPAKFHMSATNVEPPLVPTHHDKHPAPAGGQFLHLYQHLLPMRHAAKHGVLQRMKHTEAAAAAAGAAVAANRKLR